MNYLSVTTFSQNGFDLYGKRMIETFIENMVGDLIVFTDEPLTGDVPQSPRVRYEILGYVFPEVTKFKYRHCSPICHGRFGDTYDYKFDAVKFSHKPAAIAATQRLISDGMVAPPAVLIWFDGDTVFKTPMSEAFLEERFPSWAHYGSFVRDNNHMEGGIIMFRYAYENVPVFIRILWECYEHDQLFRMPAWTDCHVMDILAAGATKDGFLRTVNLGDEASFFTQHPIVNSEWRRYVDHLKGARKEAGQSHETDFIVKV